MSERAHTKGSFTPGPWAIKRSPGLHDGAHDYAISAVGAMVLSEAFGRGALGEWLPAEANACLIAAAPDMFEALKAAREPSWETLRWTIHDEVTKHGVRDGAANAAMAISALYARAMLASAPAPASGRVDAVERVAAIIDPEIWAIEQPIPTRAHVEDFHQRRRSSRSARLGHRRGGGVMTEVVLDKHGREIVAGDILQVYHFTAALRRKKHYMFKQAMGVVYLGKQEPVPFMSFSHLNFTEERYYERCDGRHLADYEIVQSIDCKFDERPRVVGKLADADTNSRPEDSRHG